MDVDITPEKAAELGLGSLSDQAVNTGRELAQQARTAADAPEGYVYFPNGGRKRISDLDIDHGYLAGDHTSIFTDTSKFLKSPLPGAMYVWAKKDDPGATARVRRGAYRRVEIDELTGDCDLPVSALDVTHKTAGKKSYVVMYDVQLMEVGPEWIKELYGVTAAMAIAKQLGGEPFQQLRHQVHDVSRGQARVEVTSKKVMSPVGE